MKKRNIVSLGLGVDYVRTYSCYNGGVTPRGVCATCVERADAFWSLGMRDPLFLQDRWNGMVVALANKHVETGAGDLILPSTLALPSTPASFQIHSKEQRK
jgi:hypothetical protein